MTHYGNISLRTNINLAQSITPSQPPKCLLTLSVDAKEMAWRQGSLWTVRLCYVNPLQLLSSLFVSSSIHLTAGLRYFTRESSWIKLLHWKLEALGDSLSLPHALSIISVHTQAQSVLCWIALFNGL